jgi:hypothetical protein
MSCGKACCEGGNNNKTAKNKKPDEAGTPRIHAALLGRKYDDVTGKCVKT